MTWEELWGEENLSCTAFEGRKTVDFWFSFDCFFAPFPLFYKFFCAFHEIQVLPNFRYSLSCLCNFFYDSLQVLRDFLEVFGFWFTLRFSGSTPVSLIFPEILKHLLVFPKYFGYLYCTLACTRFSRHGWPPNSLLIHLDLRWELIIISNGAGPTGSVYR